MRLLQIDENGEFSLTKNLIDNIPPYAILSHTWGKDDEEVSFKDLTVGPRKTKSGYKKLRFCAKQATHDGLQYFWIDTCCINKSSDAELSESINSMFRWYKNAMKCYVYLSDVLMDDSDQNNPPSWESAFQSSRWFTRGWTLQELLAPPCVDFFSSNGQFLGDKISLEQKIQDITGIPARALPNTALNEFSIDERMSWAESRQTRRLEDKAYSLLGIFDIHMPLIYGEGSDNALRRLKEEINKRKPAEIPSIRNPETSSTLDSLPIAQDAPFYVFDQQHELTCLPNTRVDLLQEIYKWADGQDGQRIFWLNGLAGTGKSTIARTVARHYFDANCLGASFFFSRGGGDVGRAGKFVTSIAVQLASSIPGLQQHMCNAIVECRDVATRSLYDQWNELILRPLSKLDGNDCQSSQVIVIDALDECDNDDHIRTIIHILAEVRGLERIQIRFFLTSRPEVPIRLGFYQIPNAEHQDFVLHNISPSIIDHDITIFLEYNLTLIRHERSLSTAWPGDEAIRKMVQKASGLFIWAATACRFIREGRRFVAKRLDKILAAGSDGVTEPEKRLDEIYTTVLKQSISPKYTEEEKEEAFNMLRQVLGSIVILFSPLSISSLGGLIGVWTDDIDQTLADLHSVLAIPQDSNRPLRLHHPSFRDFLLDDNRCTNPNFWVDEREAHIALANSCMRLMSDSLKQDVLGVEAPGILVADLERGRVDQNLVPEVQYACRYWIQHLQRGCAHLHDDDQVHQFLQKHLLHWLEALGWMGQVTEGVYAITLLESLTVSAECRRLSEFIHDVKRFVLFNRTVIEQAPLQTYSGALIFTPTTSKIRNQFENCIPCWIRRLPEVDDNWSALLQTLEGHSDSVTSVVFSADGKQLASGSDDKTIKLWDAGSGALLQTLEGHSSWVWSVVFSADGKQLASGSDDKTIKLWDAGSGALLQTLEGHSDSVTSVVFSADGKQLASGSVDKTIKLWDAGSGALLQTLEGHSSWVSSVVFSADGKQLASGSDDKTIKLWDAGSGALLQTLKGHSDSVSSVVFSADGKQLASGSDDRTIKLWDAGSGALLQTLEGHSSWVSSVVFSADGKQLASGSNDRTIKLWDAGSGALLQTLKGHSGSVRSVVFSADGKQLASGSDDGTIKLWDAGSGALLQTLKGHSSSVSSVVFSADGKQLASGSDDRTIKLWDAGSGALLQTLKGHSGSVRSVVFSADGKQLASGSNDETIKLWDAGSGALLQTLKGHSGSVRSVVFSADGKQLASGSNDRTIKLWDAGSGALLQTLEGHSSSVWSVVFSADGKQLASGSVDRTIKLWDAGSGALLQTLKGHSDSVWSVVFSADGKQLASGSVDRTIKLWDAGSGALLQTLKGHSSWVWSVVFSADGKQLASGSNDRTIKLWDAGSGALLQTLNVEAVPIVISFSDDGMFLQTNMGGLRIQDWSTSALVSQPDVQQSIFVGERWISCSAERVLWVPPEYRPSSVAVYGSVVGLGCQSGRVMLMAFAF